MLGWLKRGQNFDIHFLVSQIQLLKILSNEKRFQIKIFNLKKIKIEQKINK